MLRAMLDSHPQLAVPPESYFVVPALTRADRYELAGGIDADALLDAVAADPSFTEWQVPASKVRARWQETAPADVAAAILDLYALYAAEHGKPRAGDKTPQHVLSVEQLARAFPGARILHIVRDGRNVVPSLVGMHFGPDHFGAAALFWRDRVTRGRAGGERVGPSRYREIRYEDLVAAPEPTLRGVCEFFELPFDPAMLEYHTRADELLDGLRFTHHVQGIRRPPASEGRDWRSTMPDHDVQLFEALAGDALDAFGYERSGLPASSRARVEAAAWRTGTTVERRTRTLRTRVARRLPALPFGRSAPDEVRA
jgi:hypothetical protein